MVSSPQYLAYLPVLADEAAGSCKSGRILLMHDQILTQHLVFQRRATIIVNIISIIDPIIMVITIHRYFPELIFRECAFIACFAIGISGAISYNKNFVVVSLIAHCVKVGISAPSYHQYFPLVTMIIQALFAYPNAVLVKEIKDGIMTPHNYENEKQSCCCV